MRRYDSGWRDTRLPLVHSTIDLPVPVAGMSLVMVEYDRAEALAVINYVRRDASLANGPDAAAAYTAFGRLRSPLGVRLPFLTARYDPRNWAMQLFPHNETARELLGCDNWLPVTEQHFARLLYRLRGRTMPDLELMDVSFNTAPWLDYESQQKVVSWPGQDLSVRRRAYEPEDFGLANGMTFHVPFNLRMPCTDIDMAVVGKSGAVRLLVDFKLHEADVDPKHHTHRAMGGILSDSRDAVPSVIVKYDPSGDHWCFHVLCLNRAAEDLLTPVMTGTNAVAPNWRPDGWTYVDESRWFDLLDVARSA